MYKKPFPEVHAVDFDGLLCEDKYPQIGKSNMEAIEFFLLLQDKGDKLILNTCRCEEHLIAAVEWCRKHGLVFDAVNTNLPERIEQYGGDCRKISADYYWDDKNMNVDNIWFEKDLKNMVPITLFNNTKPTTCETVTRESILDNARQIITIDRETQYGKPEDNFSNIAHYWTNYLNKDITAHDVAIMMALLKIARIQGNSFKADSFIDCIGYLACGAEIASK